jgi:hypothetical protein
LHRRPRAYGAFGQRRNSLGLTQMSQECDVSSTRGAVA